MAGVMSNLSSVFLPRQLGNSRRYFFKSSGSRVLENRIFAAQVRASSSSSSSSTAIVETKSPTDPVVVEKEVSTNRNILACPICYDSLTWVGNPGLSVESAAGSTLQCSTCKKSYIGNETHLDLTAASGAKNYGEPMPLSTELFRLPLISFLYERGWRQSFSVLGGFPGPEKEFELMRDFLKPVLGGNIVDASCGSGLFSRLFAKSGLFSRVVALDYSENMLQQCYEFIKQEGNFPKENLILVRADISRLPFVSSSVDAVHAGAALHCWPSPSAAMEGGSWPPYKSERLPLVTDLGEHVYKHLLVAEISRVLRPGGVFVATTFMLDGPYSFLPFFRTVCQNTTLISGNHLFVSERELEDLCRACGLVGFTCIRNRRFVMISASKPI